jgi:hypothetical protein
LGKEGIPVACRRLRRSEARKLQKIVLIRAPAFDFSNYIWIEEGKMISENESNRARQHRVFFTPLKPKRRFKLEGAIAAELCPVAVEVGRHHRARIRRSGRLHTQWRRVTPPSELSETMPKRSHSELLARVTDKVKGARTTTGHWQGIWAMVRQFALAFR